MRRGPSGAPGPAALGARHARRARPVPEVRLYAAETPGSLHGAPQSGRVPRWQRALARMSQPRTVTLYRPVGPAELDLIEASGWRKFPPRLPEQPIFYPVLNEGYAAQIAQRWNVPESGVGYVTAFDV